MPASQAYETRIPRQIQQRVAAATKRYEPAEPESAPAATTDPATAPAVAATPAEPAADPRHADPAYWENRFKVTSGMLAAERLARKDMEDRLTRQITELQTQTRTLQAAAPPAPIDIKEFFSEDEIKQYGAEQCEAMARGALRAAEKTADKRIDAEVRPLREQQERDAKNAAEKAKQDFLDAIEAASPGFDDDDPGWRTWLAEIDPSTDAPHQAVLNIHIGNRNVAGIVKMITAWKATLKAPLVPPITPSGTGAAPAEGNAAPTAEAVAGLTPPDDAEVKDFFKRAALGKVKDAERTAFEARMKLRQRPRAVA